MWIPARGPWRELWAKASPTRTWVNLNSYPLCLVPPIESAQLQPPTVCLCVWRGRKEWVLPLNCQISPSKRPWAPYKKGSSDILSSFTAFILTNLLPLIYSLHLNKTVLLPSLPDKNFVSLLLCPSSSCLLFKDYGSPLWLCFPGPPQVKISSNWVPLRSSVLCSPQKWTHPE